MSRRGARMKPGRIGQCYLFGEREYASSVQARKTNPPPQSLARLVTGRVLRLHRLDQFSQSIRLGCWQHPPRVLRLHELDQFAQGFGAGVDQVLRAAAEVKFAYGS